MRRLVDVADRRLAVEKVADLVAGKRLIFEEALRQAAGRWRALLAQSDAAAYRDGLANAQNNLGNVLAQDGRLADAAEAFREAAGLARELVGRPGG